MSPDLLPGDSAVLGELVEGRLRDLQVPRKLIDGHHLRRPLRKPGMSLTLPFHSGIRIAVIGGGRPLLASARFHRQVEAERLKGTHPRAGWDPQKLIREGEGVCQQERWVPLESLLLAPIHADIKRLPSGNNQPAARSR